MGHLITSEQIAIDGEQLTSAGFNRAKQILLIITIIGSIIATAIFIFASDSLKGTFAYSWLFALAYALTIAMGGCFWTLLHNLSNSGWGVSVRRLMENLGFVFPFLGILCIPFLFPDVQQYLWEWMTKHKATGVDMFSSNPSRLFGFWGGQDLIDALYYKHEALLASKAWYLNIFAWTTRSVFYFVGLGWVIWRLRKISVAQDTDPKPGVARLFQARAFSAAGLPILAITATFLAIDWFMSLNYAWFSTMWGVYIFAGCALHSMVVLILTAIILQKNGYLKNVVSPEHFHIMGKLTHVFVIFWAYITFSQFFLIWYSNIAEETMYFTLRNTAGWYWVSLTLVFGHFALPFVLLLPHWMKKNVKYIKWVCIYLLVLHVVDMYHVIIPQRGPSLGLILGDEPVLWFGGIQAVFLDIFALVIVSCGFAYFYLRNLGSVNVYPNRDPRIIESANLSN